MTRVRLTLHRTQRSVQQKGRKPRKARSSCSKRENMRRTCVSWLKHHAITCRSRESQVSYARLIASPLMRRNHGLAAALLEGGNTLGGGIPAIGDDLLEREPLQEGVSRRAVMPLSSGHKHAQRMVYGFICPAPGRVPVIVPAPPAWLPEYRSFRACLAGH